MVKHTHEFQFHQLELAFEEWRPVVGYEASYEVSSYGRVKRIGKATGAQPGRILSISKHNAGYLFANLWQNNEGYPYLVHRLVAEAFIGSVDGYEVNHINGNKHDNRLINLEIVTRQQNVDHALLMGLTNNFGENNPMSKLNAQQVQEIRAKYMPGKVGYKHLAKEYSVQWETIRNVVKGRTWMAEPNS